MCRFAAYIGHPLLINDVVSKPCDSLIKQSLSAKESEIKLNADGFGIGWYNPQAHEYPSVYVNILPAWNDINLRSISHNIMSPCFFGHVRAAEVGGVSYSNCHPFTFEKYMFMHNGSIGGYKKIKLALYELLDENVFYNIKGQTDSETIFGLWLTYYLKEKNNLTGMISAWRQTLATIEKLSAASNIRQFSYINAVVTDGKKLVAVRYSNDPSCFLTLHYCVGKEFVHTKNGFYMLPEKPHRYPEAVLVASERISVHENEWADISEQHFLAVDENKSFQILPI